MPCCCSLQSGLLTNSLQLAGRSQLCLCVGCSHTWALTSRKESHRTTPTYPQSQISPTNICSVLPSPLLGRNTVLGQDAKYGAWPWQVSVQRNGFHLCGGSLISKSWVVSVAHCFNPSVADSSYRVQLGENRIFGQNRIHSFSLVKRIIPHPCYNNVTSEADIALVELKNPIAFTATISPVGLLDASVRVPAGETCWVTGWGNTSPQSDNTFKLPPYVPQPKDFCLDKASSGKAASGNMKPSRDGESTIGDGGGPLVCKKDRTWYLAGIASWFLTTTVNGVTRVVPGYPGVYNRLNSHNDWIKANVPGVTFIPNSAPPTGTDPSATILRVLLLTMFLQLTL
uniref:Peptidase S1 domain-containing protein n=1 Tax=Chrysemys picta bellii TaxID=8478 RepID=A0A8C3FSK2_CHRPI